MTYPFEFIFNVFLYSTDYQRFLQRFLNLHSLISTPTTPSTASLGRLTQRAGELEGSTSEFAGAALVLPDSVRTTLFVAPTWSVRLMLTHAFLSAFCAPYNTLCYSPYPPVEFLIDSVDPTPGATAAPAAPAGAPGYVCLICTNLNIFYLLVYTRILV